MTWNPQQPTQGRQSQQQQGTYGQGASGYVQQLPQGQWSVSGQSQVPPGATQQFDSGQYQLRTQQGGASSQMSGSMVQQPSLSSQQAVPQQVQQGTSQAQQMAQPMQQPQQGQSSQQQSMQQQGTQFGQQGGGVMPAVDVYQGEEELVIHVDLPGFDKKNISIHADGRSLLVSAERTQKSNKDQRALQLERPTRFERSIPLPVVIDPESTKADYDNGVCKITIPRGEEAKGSRIGVE